jgi:hypothetical protein
MRCTIFSAGPPTTTAASSPSVSWSCSPPKTGDAWLLDPADRLAARLARDGESEPIHIEETDAMFAIGWKGRYRIEGPAFVYSDQDAGRVTTILGYPTDKLRQIA